MRPPIVTPRQPTSGSFATYWHGAIIIPYINRVPRPALTEQDQRRGRVLGQVLAQARGSRSCDSVARASGVVVDTLRAIERGSVASPGVFVVSSVARTLGLTVDEVLDDVARRVTPEQARHGGQPS